MLALYISTVLAEEGAEILDLTTSYQDTVKRYPYTIIKFYSPTCPACVKVKPIYEQLAAHKFSKPVVFAEVDCIEAVDRCRADGIQGWPTVRFYAQGQFIDRYRNVHLLEAYVDWIEEMLSKW